MLVAADSPKEFVEEPVHINKQAVTEIQRINADKLPQPIPEAKTVSVQTTLVGGKQDWLVAAGIPESEWAAVDSIVSRESGWRHTAWNTQGSGAYGLCQALPAHKMESAGLDYMVNPVTQLKWCDGYAKSRYGSWQAAVEFWNENHWW